MEAMHPNSEEDDQLQLQLQAQVWKRTYGFADSLIVKTSIYLGVFNTVYTHGPISLSSLAALITSLPADSTTQNLYRIIRFLVSVGLLNEDENLRYSLTELGELLVDGERSLAKWALVILDNRSMSCWDELSSSCNGAEEFTQSTAFERLYGASVWESAGKDEGLNKLINDAMASDTQLVVPAFINTCAGVMADVRSMVDVGGGTGAAMIAVAEAFPWIKCTAFDLPHVVETAVDCNKSVSLVVGNMFDGIPHCDAVLLKFMLHNFEDGDCIRILGKCKEAIPEVGGKVIIIEIVMDWEEDGSEKEKAKAALDLDMMLTSHQVEEGGLLRNGFIFSTELDCQGMRSSLFRPFNPSL